MDAHDPGVSAMAAAAAAIALGPRDDDCHGRGGILRVGGDADAAAAALPLLDRRRWLRVGRDGSAEDTVGVCSYNILRCAR